MSDLTLKIATMERARWWLSVDAPLLEQVRQDGKLTAETVGAIATAYRVRRTLGPPGSLQSIADVLNVEVASWPPDLVGRARVCVRAAERIFDQKITTSAPYSAVTKLMWFLKPMDWTVFDQYAAGALGAQWRKTGLRVDRFYATLSDAGFLDAANIIDDVLRPTLWRDLRGARVLDSWLMLHGGFKFLLKQPEACKGFIASLPGESGKSLEAVSIEIAASLALSRFTPHGCLR